MPGVRARIDSMLTIWRRHTQALPPRTRGRDVLKCNCPLWADGYINGKRVLRQSLGTRDMTRGRKKAVALESPDNGVYKPPPAAIEPLSNIGRAGGLKFLRGGR